MVLESAQLLSEAHRFHDPGTTLSLVRMLRWQRKHPCAMWTHANGSNYAWLWALAMELADEFTFRFDKRHACLDSIEGPLRIIPKTLNLDSPRTPFVQVMPDEYKTSNAVAAYRRYYAAEKLRFAKWERGRTMPYWLKGE